MDLVGFAQCDICRFSKSPVCRQCPRTDQSQTRTSGLAAQESWTGRVLKSALPLYLSPTMKDEYDDIPDEYIEEADDYFGKCTQNYLTSQYVNCACMSTALLRERIEAGPTVPQNAIAR